MVELYVAAASYGGSNQGTAANPFLGWASINWSSLVAGSTLRVVGNLPVPEWAEIGAHGGAAGAPVTITSVDATSKLSVAGSYYKTLRIGRSFTRFLGLVIDGNISIAGDTYPLAGKEVTLDSCSVTNGVTFQTGNADATYSAILLDRCDIASAVSSAVYLLGTGTTGAPRTYRIDGLQILNTRIHDAAGSGVELRFEGADKVSNQSYLNNVVIDRCTIEDLGYWSDGGCCLRLTGCQAGTITPLSDGLTITNNVLRRDGRYGDECVGGVCIEGWGANAKGWGANKFSNNSVSDIHGAYGGCDIITCTSFDVDDNAFENVSSGTIDGNGVLVDMFNKRIRVRRNKMRGIFGSDAFNSGAAIMILGSTSDVEVADTECNGAKVGLWVDSTSARVVIHDNAFEGCTSHGARIATTQKPVLRGNLFSAGDSEAVPVEVSGQAGFIDANNVFVGFQQDGFGYDIRQNTLGLSHTL